MGLITISNIELNNGWQNKIDKTITTIGLEQAANGSHYHSKHINEKLLPWHGIYEIKHQRITSNGSHYSSKYTNN